MGKYLDNAPMGPNVKRLLSRFIAVEAIPAGGGFADGLDYLMNPDRMKAVNRAAVTKLDVALEVVKAAPDNPYDDDDEQIAAAILTKIDAKKGQS